MVLETKSKPKPCKPCTIILEPLGVIPLKTMTVIREAKAVAGRETRTVFQRRFSLGFESAVKKTETSRAKRMATGEK